MKIMFLVFHSLASHSGISKKILSQVEALRFNGAQVSLCNLGIREDGSKCRLMDGENIAEFGTGLKAKIKKRIDYSDIVRAAERGSFDLVYVRYDINSDPFTVRLMRGLHRKGIKTVVEIPTYPYDGEFKGQGLLMNLQLLIDKLFRKKFFSYCDKVVSFSEESRIFGKEVIRISNGVDLDKVPLTRHHPYIEDGLRLLSVANVHLWHGLDRLIRGMGEQRDIPCELHIVGDGLEQIFEEYRDLARSYGIEDRVKIIGPLYGDALEREFEWADVAVGSLGRHRSGVSRVKTLKNREYAARGFCFFYSEDDPDFDDKPYVKKFPADESEIDIWYLYEFYTTVDMTPQQIRESVKDLDWKVQMKRVIDAIS